MGRPPCCDERDLKKGPWTPEEDQKLVDHIKEHGHGSWRTLPKLAGLNRCGKSCRLRWANYLRPDIKRGKFTEDEERIIINLHAVLGNKWSRIAGHLPGRTDNEIKNYWNTYLRKKLLQMGIDPSTHKPRTDINHLMNISQLLGLSNLSGSMNLWGNPLAMQSADITQVAKLQLLQNLLQSMNPSVFLNLVNPSLLANHSLNNPFPGLVNRTNTDLLIGLLQQYANRGLFNPQQCSPQANTKSESGTEDGMNDLEFFAVNNSLSTSQSDLAVNNNFITSRDHPTNYVLPPLVSDSSTTACSPSNLMEGTCNPTQDSTQSPSSSSVFEAWEKLMDDDTSGTYWTEILDFSLASTSASPDVSW